MTALGTVRERASLPARETLVGVVFGDRIGVVLFLGAMIFSVLTWRIGFFINDSYTVANAFASLADGRLSVGEILYGPDTGRTPGMVVVDGQLYGRNYGQLVVAVPFLWLLWAAAAVADAALLLVALFSSLLLGFFVHLGKVLDRETALTRVGVGVGLLGFGLDVPFAVELQPHWHPLVALQFATAIAAALIVVVTYRLVRRMYDSRIAAFAGSVVALASPVPFWATIPKRHSATTLLVLLSVYCFYRSRAADGNRSATRFHALAYLWVGFAAWIHSPLGLILLAALLTADALTLGRIGRRRIAVVATTFVASLLPFLLTNWFIAGNPLEPPLLLPEYTGGEEVVLGDGSTSPSDGSGGSQPGSGGGSQPGSGEGHQPGSGGDSGTLPDLIVGTASTAVAVLELFANFVSRGFDSFFDGDRLYHTFVRSGYLDGVGRFDGSKTVTLAVLEWSPLLAGLIVAPVVLWRTFRRGLSTASESSAGPLGSVRRVWALRRDPIFATDVFVVSIGFYLLAIYLPLLPLQATWTVRYLHPLYVLGVYGLVRIGAVRAVVREEWRLLAWSYAAFLLVGGQLLVALLASIEPTQGEAVQFHALVGVGFAIAMAVTTVANVIAADRVSPATERWLRRAWAVVIAACCAATTALLLLWGLVYFPYAPFALPGIEEIASSLAFLQ